jgi:trans-aconitate 2-methyltransferase
MRADWNPALYERFEDERTRPARDLLANVPLAEATHVVDLGCGPGNSTALLVERFPEARVVGTDSSEAMLASARARLPGCSFEHGDVSTWQATVAPDLIFANALFQWLPKHEVLLPRLLSALAPGGVLALQMPDNLEEPSHRLMREVAADAPWASAIGDASRLRSAVLSISAYYDLLAQGGTKVEIWRTVYQHPLSSPAAIVEWLKATGLRPFLDPLTHELQSSFLTEYEARIARAYPAQVDGRSLLAFPRLFVVARRSS